MKAGGHIARMGRCKCVQNINRTISREESAWQT